MQHSSLQFTALPFLAFLQHDFLQVLPASTLEVLFLEELKFFY